MSHRRANRRAHSGRLHRKPHPAAGHLQKDRIHSNGRGPHGSHRRTLGPFRRCTADGADALECLVAAKHPGIPRLYGDHPEGTFHFALPRNTRPKTGCRFDARTARTRFVKRLRQTVPHHPHGGRGDIHPAGSVRFPAKTGTGKIPKSREKLTVFATDGTVAQVFHQFLVRNDKSFQKPAANVLRQVFFYVIMTTTLQNVTENDKILK